MHISSSIFKTKVLEYSLAVECLKSRWRPNFLAPKRKKNYANTQKTDMGNNHWTLFTQFPNKAMLNKSYFYYFRYLAAELGLFGPSEFDSYNSSNKDGVVWDYPLGQTAITIRSSVGPVHKDCNSWVCWLLLFPLGRKGWVRPPDPHLSVFL